MKTIRLEPQGWSFVAEADQTVLQSALAAGVRMPSSCRNGTCRACLCQLQSGEIAYRIEWPGLSRDEKDAGSILPCVAYPQTAIVIVSPEATRMTSD